MLIRGGGRRLFLSSLPFPLSFFFLPVSSPHYPSSPIPLSPGQTGQIGKFSAVSTYAYILSGGLEWAGLLVSPSLSMPLMEMLIRISIRI